MRHPAVVSVKQHYRKSGGRPFLSRLNGCAALLLVCASVSAVAGGLRSSSAAGTSPVVTSAAGATRQGATLAISGSGFGTPDPNELLSLWQNFDSGDLTKANVCDNSPCLGLYHPEALQVAGEHPRTSIPGDLQYRRNHNNLGGLEYYPKNYTSYFISFYYRLSDNFDIASDQTPGGTHQLKIVRLYSSGSATPNVYPGIGTDGYHFGLDNFQPEVIQPCEYLPIPAPPRSDQPSDGWHKMTMLLVKSSASGARDGKLLLSFDNNPVFDWKAHFSDPALIQHNSSCNIPGDFDSNGADFALDLMLGNYFSSASPATYVEFDDYYVSHTQAHVELGNADTHSGSTILELQPPSTWSDQQITIPAANLGALGTGPVWVYVTAPDGSYNESGFPLGTTAPPPTTTSSTAPPAPCTPGPDQAALYEHTNYQGRCVVKGIGTYNKPTALAPLLNNTASSLRVGANVQINPCKAAGLTGYCQTFRTDVADLTGSALGNDTTTSAQVEPRTPPCYPNADQVALYEHSNFQGACAIRTAGTYNDAATLTPVPDNAGSSVRVGANVSARLCQGTSLTGTCQTFLVDMTNLTGSTVGNDTTSSVQVTLR